jgi:hypothetical protein
METPIRKRDERCFIVGPPTNFVLLRRGRPVVGFKRAVHAFFQAAPHRKHAAVLAALLYGGLYEEMYFMSYDVDSEEYLHAENGGLSIREAKSESMLSFLGYKTGVAVEYADNKLVNKLLDVLFAIVPGLHRWMVKSGYSKFDFANVSVTYMLGLTRAHLHAIERAI